MCVRVCVRVSVCVSFTVICMIRSNDHPIIALVSIKEAAVEQKRRLCFRLNQSFLTGSENATFTQSSSNLTHTSHDPGRSGQGGRDPQGLVHPVHRPRPRDHPAPGGTGEEEEAGPGRPGARRQVHRGAGPPRQGRQGARGQSRFLPPYRHATV